MPPTPKVIIGGGSRATGQLVDPGGITPGISIAEATEGFRQAGELLAQKAQQDQIDTDKLAGVKEFNDRTETYRLAQAELDQDKLSPTYLEDSAALVAVLNEGAGEDIKTRQVRDSLSADLDTFGTNQTVAFSLGRTDAIVDDTVLEHIKSADAIAAAVVLDPDGFQIHIARHAALVKNLPDLPAAEQKAQEEAFADKITQARIEGLAQFGRGDEARALLRESAGAFKLETVRAMARRIREIETLTQQGALAAVTRQVADISVAVTDARSLEELQALRDQVDTMDADGQFPGALQGKRVALIRAIETKRKAIASGDKSLLEGLRNFSGGLGFDDPKQADLVYGLLFKDLVESGATPEQINSMTAQFVKDGGIVPPAVKNRHEAAEVVESPTLLAGAAASVLRIREAARDADTGAGPRVEATIALHVLGGQTLEEAAIIVTNGLPDAATRAVREKEFEELIDDFDVEDFLDDAGIIDDRTVLGITIFADPASIADRVRVDALEAFRIQYMLTGNEKVAALAAQEAMKGLYGQTTVGGGDPRVVRTPPHKIMPNPGGILTDAQLDKVVTADLGVGLAQREIEAAAPLNEEDTSPPATLFADAQTRREVAAGGPVSYSVRVRNSFGMQSPVNIQEGISLRQMRYTLPSATEMQSMPAYQEVLTDIRSNDQGALALRDVQSDVAKGLRPELFTGELGPLAVEKAVEARRIELEEALLEQAQAERVPIAPEQILERAEDIGDITRGAVTIEETQEGPTSLAQARGIRNHNPGNIRKTSTQWQGMAVEQPDKSFVTFATPEMGIRAMARVLMTYQNVHGIRRVEDFIKRWAPPNENNTSAYVKAVAKDMGVGPIQLISIRKEATMLSLLKAIIKHENGSQPYTDEQLKAGIQAAK